MSQHSRYLERKEDWWCVAGTVYSIKKLLELGLKYKKKVPVAIDLLPLIAGVPDSYQLVVEEPPSGQILRIQNPMGSVLHITVLVYLFKNKTNTIHTPYHTNPHTHQNTPEQEKEHSILKTVLREGIPSCVSQWQHLWDKSMLPGPNVPDAALIWVESFQDIRIEIVSVILECT